MAVGKALIIKFTFYVLLLRFCCESLLQSGELLKYNQHHYVFFTEETSWPTAQAACNDDSGYLVSLNDAQEHAAVISWYSTVWHRSVYSSWVGVHCHGDDCESANLTWDDGTSLAYKPWGTFSPQYIPANRQHLLLNTSRVAWLNLADNFVKIKTSEVEALRICEYVDVCASAFVNCTTRQACLQDTNITDHTCACTVGFTGTDCEANIDDCAGVSSCSGGVCVDGINAFTCVCAGTGKTGQTCDTNLSEGR